MTCAEVRGLLALHLDGDMPGAVASHLGGCPSCRAELEGLRAVCGLLDASPAPRVAVDVPNVREEAARRESVRAWRWRRAGAAAVAAGVLLALGALAQVELVAGGNQLVLRWGGHEPMPPPKADSPDLGRVEERLRVLDELVQLVAADVESRDLRQREEVVRLRLRLARLSRDVRQSGADAEDLATLTRAFEDLVNEKGAKP